MNRILRSLQQDKKLLSIYFTAGHPHLEDTVPIIKGLQEAGADMIEIGLPFSDPLADGPTIQSSANQALKNGMSSSKLFEQLIGIRDSITVPLIVMGYFNPIFQYGVAKFCEDCKRVGIDGLIIPDLPLEIYKSDYKHIFKTYDLFNMFLITPQTSEARIRQIDQESEGFIYMVSSSSTTGAKTQFGEEQTDYFRKIYGLHLKSPLLVGFGISNVETFETATHFAKGAIIGSAFIQYISKHSTIAIPDFIKSIKG